MMATTCKSPENIAIIKIDPKRPNTTIIKNNPGSVAKRYIEPMSMVSMPIAERIPKKALKNLYVGSTSFYIISYLILSFHLNHLIYCIFYFFIISLKSTDVHTKI